MVGLGLRSGKRDRERMRKKTQEKQVTYNAITPPTLTDAQLILKL